jgi:hypothetical protein
MFSASSLASDEVQGVTEAATSMLATILGKRAQLHDSQWKVRRKNSLGNVTTDTDLLALLESVEEAWGPANEQQASKLRSFLYRRFYDQAQVTDYGYEINRWEDLLKGGRRDLGVQGPDLGEGPSRQGLPSSVAGPWVYVPFPPGRCDSGGRRYPAGSVCGRADSGGLGFILELA